MLAQVRLRACRAYDRGSVSSAIGAVLEDCSVLGALLRPGATVLLKPNVVNPQPSEYPTCTHPAVVRAVAEFVHDAGCRVIVADQPCYAMARTAEYVLGVPGYIEALKDLPVETHLLNAAGFAPVKVTDPYFLDEVAIARLVLQADVVISLAKCKTHVQTQYTGAIKNMFGALAPRRRLDAHAVGPASQLSRSVVDIFSACVPHLTVMDAVVGMEGPGPNQGPPRQLGFIAASTDAVALDAVVAQAVGFRTREVATIRYAAERGLGCDDLGAIAVSGDDPADFRVRFARPPRLYARVPGVVNRLARRFMYCRPVVDRSACVGCGGCRDVCPGEAISVGRHAHIEYNRCLECYCCLEACPHHAMRIGRSWLAGVVSPAR